MENTKEEVESTPDHFFIPSHVLDDLCCRFIINVPAQEKKDLVRICFQIEQAHWFYLDFYSKKFSDTLRPCNLKEFARNIFNHIRYLRPRIKDLDLIIDDWKEYKYSVPTFGAIIVDDESKHILLVRSYWSKTSWGFPKGKINKDETPCHCATREVYEETGFNISSLIHPDVYIETVINEQTIRLYIVTGVSKNTTFSPQTRCEIKDIKWFPIDTIPIKKTKVKNKLNSIFYMVIPFMRDLRKWILKNSAPKIMGLQRRSFKSFSEVEDLLHTTSVEEGQILHHATYSYSVIKDGDSQKPKNIGHPDNENEVECYEGSDEDDAKRSNDEIYGIPKVKSFINGKDLDSNLLTCSDVSYIKKNKLKNNVDQILSKSEKKVSTEPLVVTPNYANSEKFVNNIEKNMRSIKISDNVNIDTKKAFKNASHNFNFSLNNSTEKENAQKKTVKKLFSNDNESHFANQKISNLFNKALKGIGIDVEKKPQNSFIPISTVSASGSFSKSEFMERLCENKDIQAMKQFKFNREALFRSLE